MKIIPESFYDKFSFFRDPTQANMESEAGKEEISGSSNISSNKPRSIQKKRDNFVWGCLANSICFFMQNFPLAKKSVLLTLKNKRISTHKPYENISSTYGRILKGLTTD